MIGEFDIARIRAFSARYQDALEKMGSTGVRLNSNCRLVEYGKIIEKLAEGYIPHGPSENIEFCFQILEADEFLEISALVTDDSIAGKLQIKLQSLVQGPILRGGNKLYQGRSTQFELLILSLLNKSGLSCRLGEPEASEPDIIAKTLGTDFQLEVKRPTSRNSLNKNIKKALSQLNAENPGAIVVSLDHLLFGVRNIIQLENNETLTHAVEYLNNVVDGYIGARKIDLVAELRNKRSATAIIWLARVPVQSWDVQSFNSVHCMRIQKLVGFSKDMSLQLSFLAGHLEKVWGKADT